MGAKGPRWELQVKSLSLGDEEQTIVIYQRRDASFCIASQKIGTRESNRVEIWKTERTGFPDESYDEVGNPLIVYIVKTADNTYWAGWFYLNEGYHFKMNSATAAMFAKDDGYIKFEQDVEIDTKKYKWPFHFNFPSVIGVKDNNNNSDYMKSNNFLAALRTKPFMLLAGISGTGKSRIVRKLAQATTTQQYEHDEDRWKDNRPENFELIQVKPNWHNSMDVVGFYSNISKKYEFTTFVEFVVKAWQHIDTPYFLCLDEMNLAPVEEYFAEFLSAIESRSTDKDDNYVTDPIIKPFKKFGKEACEDMLKHLLGEAHHTESNPLAVQFAEQGLTLPPNLMVIGTVNMDETTFSFSRKVLDRAMSIEMNGVDYDKFLSGESEQFPLLTDKNELLVKRPQHASEVREKIDGPSIINYLKDVNNLFEGTPFQLGYRAANEAMLYVAASRDFAGDEFSIENALDEFTLMKILSRIEGDDSRLAIDDNDPRIASIDIDSITDDGEDGINLLNCLRAIVRKHIGQDSATEKKISVMYRTLRHEHFVSYWA